MSPEEEKVEGTLAEGPTLSKKFSIESSSDEECDSMLLDRECAEVLLIDD